MLLLFHTSNATILRNNAQLQNFYITNQDSTSIGELSEIKSSTKHLIQLFRIYKMISNEGDNNAKL